MADSIPRTSGVYQLLCAPNGKMYVGSAVNLGLRRWQHFNDLSKGIHCNQLLQRAWRKYGASAFVFSVLELVAVQSLADREQHWMDTTRCYDKSRGYNILTKAYSPLGRKMPQSAIEKTRARRAQVWIGFVDPEGNEVGPITNLSAFCREHGLSQSAMQYLAKGNPNFQSHKGWTHKDSPPRKQRVFKVYEGFIDPQGDLVPPIPNMYVFCKEHGLDPRGMVSLHKGGLGLRQHRGWTHQSALRATEPPPSHTKVWEGFIDPSGDQVVISNLAEFCRRNSLNYSAMQHLSTGKYRGKTYKKWTHVAMLRKDGE